MSTNLATNHITSHLYQYFFYEICLFVTLLGIWIMANTEMFDKMVTMSKVLIYIISYISAMDPTAAARKAMEQIPVFLGRRVSDTL